MSSLPIFDQLYTGMINVFGEPVFVFNMMFIGLIAVLLLAGVEGSVTILVVEATISMLAVYGLATYGYIGYAILLSAITLAAVLYRATIK